MERNTLSIKVILLCVPVVLWGVCLILPTFDDYTSLQSPWWVQIADPGYFFPDCVRRPFDALLGYIVGCFPTLFPTLNHVLIILGHTASACLVFSICKKLSCPSLATNIATLFFFFSPATLGATLACDGFNQTYAQLWGLLALWIYLSQFTVQSSEFRVQSSEFRVHSSQFTVHNSQMWLLCIVMAALSKENGLAWAVVPPIIGYGFGKVDLKKALRHIGYGLVVALIYFIIYYSIYKSGILNIEYDEQYMEATWADHLKDFAQLMAYTWLPADYMSIVYAPSRNWIIAGITAIISLPFLILLAKIFFSSLLHRSSSIVPPPSSLLPPPSSLLLPLTSLILCFFILVSPHLLTVVSIMHNYAALSMAALLIATLLTHSASNSKVFTLHSLFFTLYLAAALFTDIHHYIAARESGLLGQQMALQVISQAEKPLEHVTCINIDDDTEPRYSSFCVRPVDAFAWGLAVRHYSHYEWKTRIDEISLPQYNQKQVEALTDSALNSGSQAVWIVGGTKQPIDIKHP